jgi:hypothetical protein
VRRLAAVSVVLVLGLGATGCRSSKPATVTGGDVRTLVAGPARRFVRVVVTAQGREAIVPAHLLAEVVPLRAALTFSRPDPLATYGLVTPQAVLRYVPGNGAATVVQIGAANFDRHGFYVRRPSDTAVSLVLADSLRPVLALVGIDVPPPA